MSAAAKRWLLAIVLVAGALRFFGLAFGLPYPQARPDEETALGKALQVLSGDPNPRFFHWPSLTIYVLAGILWIGQVLHDLAAPARALTFSERALLARAVVALAGTATVVALHQLARSVAGERIALVASALLAAAILHVRESHFATTDTLATLLLMVALVNLVAVARDGTDVFAAGAPWAQFAMAGFVSGLATSTRYSAGVVALSMAAAQILLFAGHPRRAVSVRGWAPSIAFAVAMAAAFFITTPYAILDWPSFSRDFLFDLDHLSEPHRGIVLGRGWSYHLTHSLPYGVGIPVFVAALVGIVPFVKHYPRAAFVLGAFALPFYLAIGSGYTVFFRYVLPLVPFVCLSAAVGLDHTASALARMLSRTNITFLQRHASAIALTCLLAVTLVPAIVQSVRFDLLLARTDTRVLAGRWLESRIQPDESLYDTGNAYTQLNLWRVRFRRVEYDETARRFTALGEALSGSPMPHWLVLHDSPLWTYANAPPAIVSLAAERYVLVHEERATIETCGSDRRHADADCVHSAPAVYDVQDAFFVPFSSFSTVRRPGPDIFIYRRTDVR